jgi:Flp pilus assembly protein TadD
VLHDLAVALFQNGHVNEAVFYLELVVQTSASAKGWNNLACATVNTDIVRALSMLQQATALAPETPLYWSNLALVSNFAGDLQAASDAWRRATALYPLTQAPQDCMWEFLPAAWSS